MLCKTFASILVFATYAWSAILLDGPWGGTQAYYGTHAVGNLNFGLKHRPNSVAVTFGGRVYFIGGDNSTEVNIFDPATNMTTYGAWLNQGRLYHAATVVNNTIIVCGSDVRVRHTKYFNVKSYIHFKNHLSIVFHLARFLIIIK
jgi:hypothetical protein